MTTKCRNVYEDLKLTEKLPNERRSELLLSIPNHKRTGDDGISVKILKIAAPAVLPSLTKLLNLCISNKVFPSAWKVAKVTAVLKGNGSRSDGNNYRPISVVLVMCKLLERHICDHLCDFLRSNGILHKLQSGFTKSFSTETALIRLIDELLLSLDKDNVTGLVMIDYKKVFDLIDHTLVLQKLRAAGIDNDYVSLFESYLSDRTQYVNIDWCHSALRDANLGVSQGSMLGLILFLIFINNLPKILEYSAAEICADDTSISANVDYRSAPGVLNQILQAHVGKVAQWTTDNKMVLNESKTKVMLVAGKRLHKTMSNTSLTVHVNSVELEQVQFHKLLGVIINTQLNFNKDIDDLCKKVTQRIAVLKKIRRLLRREM